MGIAEIATPPATGYTQIKTRFGEMNSLPDEFPRDYEYKDRTIIASQFVWLHNHAIKEESLVPQSEELKKPE